MKKISIVFLSLLLFPILAFSQDKVEFDILFGTYIDNHQEKTFSARERHWIFEDGVLIYFIDAHNKRYSDSIHLSDSDVNLITNYVLENKLNQTITKDLGKDNISDGDWTAVMKGDIKINGISSSFKLDSKNPTVLIDNKYGKKLKELEHLLYEIVDRY